MQIIVDKKIVTVEDMDEMMGDLMPQMIERSSDIDDPEQIESVKKAHQLMNRVPSKPSINDLLRDSNMKPVGQLDTDEEYLQGLVVCMQFCHARWKTLTKEQKNSMFPFYKPVMKFILASKPIRKPKMLPLSEYNLIKSCIPG